MPRKHREHEYENAMVGLFDEPHSDEYAGALKSVQRAHNDFLLARQRLSDWLEQLRAFDIERKRDARERSKGPRVENASSNQTSQPARKRGNSSRVAIRRSPKSRRRR